MKVVQDMPLGSPGALPRGWGIYIELYSKIFKILLLSETTWWILTKLDQNDLQKDLCQSCSYHSS